MRCLADWPRVRSRIDRRASRQTSPNTAGSGDTRQNAGSVRSLLLASWIGATGRSSAEANGPCRRHVGVRRICPARARRYASQGCGAAGAMICAAVGVFTSEACNTAHGNQAKVCRAFLAGKRPWQSECAIPLTAYDRFSKNDGQLGVDCRPTLTTADRHPIFAALALWSCPSVTGSFLSGPVAQPARSNVGRWPGAGTCDRRLHSIATWEPAL